MNGAALISTSVLFLFLSEWLMTANERLCLMNLMGDQGRNKKRFSGSEWFELLLGCETNQSLEKEGEEPPSNFTVCIQTQADTKRVKKNPTLAAARLNILEGSYSL